jgi:3-oxoacyl-[acyl-carrier-protein] synthase-3
MPGRLGMHAAIRAIEYHLPQDCLRTEDLSREFPEWPVEKIDSKTGIQTRHIAKPCECSSDLAVAAAEKLFASGACTPQDIEFVLLCTQSPDYFLPTTACLVQDRLGIPTSAGALDYNLGCSGYVYGLGLAEGLIASGQLGCILLLTAETYSKFLHRRDRSVRTVFGDAAAATLITAEPAPEPLLGPFVYGTDGSGGPNLIVPAGGMRKPRSAETALETADAQDNIRSLDNLFMDGPEIFNFTLDAVPQCIQQLLEKSGQTLEDIDLFVFHQANRYMLDHLRKRLKIPAGKFVMAMSHCGNTVSSTIPIALKHAAAANELTPDSLVMAVGFGVGYSWGATLLRGVRCSPIPR